MSLLSPFFKLDLIYSGDLIKEKTLLEEEIFRCNKYLGYSISELEKMTVYRRKYFIDLHNKENEKEKERAEKLKEQNKIKAKGKSKR